jgi:Domain of unknown function (DUF1707)
MTGTGDGVAAGGGRGRLRASHPDRDRVIETLKAAYVRGCVTKDEFDARVSQTLASRTHAELALITADLPAGLTAAPPRPRRPARARRAGLAGASVQPGDRAIMATAILAGLALIASVFAPEVPVAGLPVAGLLVIAGVGSAFVSLFLLRTQLRGSRRDRRSGGQLPPGPAADTGLGAASAGPAPQLPAASRPPRRSKADAARGRRPRLQLSS